MSQSFAIEPLLKVKPLNLRGATGAYPTALK
jgi:hypothetical protein